MAGRILLIDDDVAFAKVATRALAAVGHDVAVCGTAGDARLALLSGETDVVVVDYQLPDADGLVVLEELRKLYPGTVFLMATAYPDVTVAVEAMRHGAFDYFAKGDELRECVMRIERAVEVASLRQRVAEATQTPGDDLTVEQSLLGESPSMRLLKSRLVALSASGDTTVFVVGETGTGKGVVARAIHGRSVRAYEPFVAVDCTTIPATLVESELFGYERGAFSGAGTGKIGRVEAAGRGTLFLDEIGELDLIMQTKLLRLLEEREFTRVGSTRSRKLDARVITATNRDLARAVEEGRFRADLRYRLEVFVVEVPPLRERGDDITLLALHFVRERSRAIGKPVPTFDDELLRAMARYPFPGNVRELRNMIEQAVLIAPGTRLTLEEFPVLKRWESGPPIREPREARGAFNSSMLPTTLLQRVPGVSAGMHLSGAGASSSGPPLGNPTPNRPRELTGYPALATGAGFGGGAPTREHTREQSSLPPYTSTRQFETLLEPEPKGADVGTSSYPSLLKEAPAKNLAEIRKAHTEIERRALVEALESSGGNITAAARELGLSRYQLLRKLTKYQLR